MNQPTEAEIEMAILATFRNEDGATTRDAFDPHAVRQRINDFGRFPDMTFDQILYHLKKLETEGNVEQVWNPYSRMICWRAKE